MIRLTRDRDFYRTMLMVALPAALQALITQAVNLADGMMVSGLGQDAMAGVSMGNAASNLFFMSVLGLVGGASVLIAQYWGKRDMLRIKQVFSIALTILIALSVAATLFVWARPELALRIVTNKPDVIRAGIPYVQVFCFTFIPYAIAQSLVGMMRTVELVKIGMLVSLVSLATNISLNWVLIYGHLGAPAMGVRGAALATVIARLVEMGIAACYAFRVQKKIPLRLNELFRSEGWLWRDFVRFGLPVAAVDASWALIGVLKSRIVGYLGDTTGGLVIAANAIADQMMTLGLLVCFALANGACVVIGKTVGARQYDKTREYSATIQWLFLLFGLFFSALVFALRGPFTWLYRGASPEVAGLAMAMIALGAPTMIGTSYHASCFVGINRGAGDSKFVMYVDMICGWLIVLPLSYLAAFVWKVDYAWMFLFLRIDQCFKWIIAFIRLRGDKWIRNVTRA